MIVIVDYGMGNLRSVWMKFERLKYESRISNNPEDIINASHLILPGVGHFEEGIKNINKLNLIEPLNVAVQQKQIPILGICLGMQLLTIHSEEGNIDGLGWINGYTKKFNFDKLNDNKQFRIPHVGWNLVEWKNQNFLMNGLDIEERFYFTHSYAVECLNQSESVGTTIYGYPFSSVIQKNNIFGTQFHPEKSHLNGLKLIQNFCKL